MIQWNLNKKQKGLQQNALEHIIWKNIHFVQASLLMTCCVISHMLSLYLLHREAGIVWSMIWWWLGNEPLSKTVVTNGLDTMYVIMIMIYM